MMGDGEFPESLLGRDVVVDINGQFVYIGKLVRVGKQFVEMADVDVRDNAESSTPKEIYIMDAKKYGIKRNRKSVYIVAGQVASMSALEDIIDY